MSTEARELELVGKVELRIALAKDDKLQTVLSTYLPPLLLKLMSEHVSVRNKVISTCQHIKIRLAGNAAVVLPVAALLKQYKDNPDSSMIRHFDLLFIQQSIGKLTSSEQLNLLPVILHGLSKDAGKPTCATLFNLFLRLLPHLRLPARGTKEDTDLRKRLGLDEHVEDARFVSMWFGKLMLLSIVRYVPASPTHCPGLTQQEYDFLTLNGKPEAWDTTASEGLNLTETKIRVLSFLVSAAFTDDEKFIAALYAAADSNSRISSVGDDILKRSTVSLEDAGLIKQLFDVYAISKSAIRTRILGMLSKSAAAANSPRDIISLVQIGITSNDPATTELKGLEAKKLRNAVFSFMNWTARMGSEESLKQIAPSVVSYLTTFIENQGWPNPNDRSPDEAAMRALAYETLGSMAKAEASVVREPELVLVKWLFRSLTEDTSSDTITISIQSALASILNAFAPPLHSDILTNLRLILLKQMTQDEGDAIVRNARFATVRWANRCLQYDDIVGRWIDVLAVGGRRDERNDVVEEGTKGLDPYWYQLSLSSGDGLVFQLPDWTELVQVLFSGRTILENSHESNTMKTGMEVDGVSVFGNFSGQKISAFPHAVAYCRRMLIFKALKSDQATDADWERQLDVLLRTDIASRLTLKQHMQTLDNVTLALWLTAAFEGMLFNDGNGLADCGKTFVELGSLAPSAAFDDLATRCEELLPAIRSNTPAIRTFAARAFGILAPHPANNVEKISNIAKTLLNDASSWRTAVGAEANRVHGALLALGYLFSRETYYGRKAEIDEKVSQDVVALVVEILKDGKDSVTLQAALICLGQFGAAGLLPEESIERTSEDLVSVVGLLNSEAKKGNERAILGLGQISMTWKDGSLDSETSPLDLVLKNLYALHELRQAEIHFVAGEALACLAGRWQSESLLLTLDVDKEYRGPMKRASVLKSMLEKLLGDCKTTKPSLKKASGIWLFCLVQHCGQLEEIQGRLRECQAAFMGLLSARDDLVQETASRGLSLVYEQGDEELRQRLVNDLVASFTGTSTKIKVDEETELFEPGALPTSDGESITSYKDIMSLAAEVGDQSLVYRFMSLASNAATWSTRAAFGRFGLSSILSESAVDPKIYPKLYRYRFDPNKNVQRSMNDIWSALVKNPSAAINEHFDAIMDDLLKNILGKEWRTRQASCSAIADLVQGRQFDMYEKYLSQIWEVAFKVLDDIKGSVRETAASLCKVLTTILVRQLEQGTSSKNAQAMLEQVIPFLFSTRGLESSSNDVRAFSYDTILKLVKSGGKTLLPFVPTIVEQILGLLSTLEPEAINYVQMNAAKYNTTAEEIDSMRSTAVSHSPLMESVERCLDLLDDSTMARLVPCLENVIKTAVGMPSKVGCSGVLISLASRHSFLFRPHADVLLKDIERAVLDRNTTVSAAYARAAGYLSRLASDTQLIRLVAFAKQLYFTAEDETKRQVSAEIVYSISKFATDRFNSMASEILPFVFLAKHDFDEHVKEQFEKTWDENVGGSRAVLLYLKEILAISQERIDSPKWAIKHTAALTIADVVSAAGSDISITNGAMIWPALEKALALKTFDGKEKLLDGFTKFIKNGKAYWEKNEAVASQTKKIAIREAKRNNAAYRPHAFNSLAEYAELRSDIDMFDEVYDVVEPRVEDLVDEDKMDTEDEDKNKAGSLDSATLTAGMNALLRAINVPFEQTPPMTHMPKLLELSKRVLSSSKSTIVTKTLFYERAKAVFTALRKRVHSQKYSYEKLAWEFFSLIEIQTGAGTESVRLVKAETAEAIAMGFLGGVFGQVQEGSVDMKQKMEASLREARAHERSLQVQTVLDRALKPFEN